MGNLGLAYEASGRIDDAIICYEAAAASASAHHDQQAEATWLGNLGKAYTTLGDTWRAQEYHMQALFITNLHKLTGSRDTEGYLGNLTVACAYLGEYDRTMNNMRQSWFIPKDTGDASQESIHFDHLASTYLMQGAWNDAITSSRKALEIADRIGYVGIQHYGRVTLALGLLFSGDLPAARAAIDAALAYDRPANMHNAHALRGLITLRQGMGVVAGEAFRAAVSHAEGQLVHAAENYEARYAIGLAQSGLALLAADSALAAEAADSYRAARQIIAAAGVVAEQLQRFDALVVADESGLLMGVRSALAGE